MLLNTRHYPNISLAFRAFLPRLPTTIGSVIASFAAASAAPALHTISHMSEKERNEYLDRLERRHGYKSVVVAGEEPQLCIKKLPLSRPPTSNLGPRGTAWASSRIHREQDELKINVRELRVHLHARLARSTQSDAITDKELAANVSDNTTSFSSSTHKVLLSRGGTLVGPPEGRAQQRVV